MISIYTPIHCFLIGIVSLSGQTINDCLPVVGETIRNVRSYTIVDPDEPAPNAVWNFLDMEVANTFIDTIKLVSSADVSFFPSANICRKADYYHGQFFNTKNGVLELVGVIAGNDLSNYGDPMLVLPQPFSVGDTAIDTWSVTGTLGPSNYVTAGTTTFVANASGHIITPGGNYNNVVRIYVRSSYTGSTTGKPAYQFIDEEHRFYCNGIPDPVLSINSRTNTTNGGTGYWCNLYYPGHNSVGLENLRSSRMVIAPNPAVNFVNIFFDDQTYSRVEICDGSGKVVQAKDVTSLAATELDLGQFSPGFYFVRCYRESGVSVQKLIVTR